MEMNFLGVRGVKKIIKTLENLSNLVKACLKIDRK